MQFNFESVIKTLIGMRKTIVLFILGILVTSCGVLAPWPDNKNYPITTFYVKNNSEKTINFTSTILKHSTMSPPYELTVPFTVKPKDSILVRQIRYKRNAEPQHWFIRFEIFPIGLLVMNNPENPNNWKKWLDIKGKPNYTFLLTK
ncbi:conserved hypothetical protein [Tenacibaculum sp. 190524A02b]|uniref:Lipoprotein n=2 Tax=Tenacibaculum vairaonense TaxID=3137860 RepID=A0ABM9PR89_9FLAO